MAEAQPRDIAKHLTWKPDARAQLRSRNRLKSYLTQTHIASPSAPEEPEASLLDLTKPANSDMRMDIETTCCKVQARLMRYPDKALTVQYNGALLRILEHCRELESTKNELEQRANVEGASRNEPLAANEAQLRGPSQLHCETCQCARRGSDVGLLASGGDQVTGFHAASKGFENHVMERQATTHRRRTSSGGISQLSKLEPPQPLFRKKSRDTSSQAGSSDFSSNGGDLLPEEEQELSALQMSNSKLGATSSVDTAGAQDHPYLTATSSSASQTTIRQMLSGHDPTSHAETDSDLACSSPSILEDDENSIKPAHRRIFSFVPGDDFANAKLQPMRGTKKPRTKSSDVLGEQIDKGVRDQTGTSRDDQVTGNGGRQHGLFGSKR